MNWTDSLTVLVALTGLIGVLGAAYLTGRHHSKQLREQEARLAIADLIKSAGIMAHTITWFTWQSKHRPDHLSAESAIEYDQTMRELYRTLTGSLAVVAAHSEEGYAQLQRIVHQIYDLDDKVAQAATGLLDGDPQAASAIGKFHLPAQQLARRATECGIALIDKTR